MKTKKFTVHYRVDGLYEAIIPVDSLEEALQKAKEMSILQLSYGPRDVLDEEARIVGVFE